MIKMSKEKNNIVKIIKISLVILWMVVVFIFSSQSGDESSKVSTGFISSIIRLFNNNISQDELTAIVAIIHPYIRKLAHFTLYTIGGFLIYNLIKDSNLTSKRKVIISELIGMLYAVSDELHQTFISQRCGSIIDVFIDSLGVLFGISIYILILKIWKKYNNAKKVE